MNQLFFLIRRYQSGRWSRPRNSETSESFSGEEFFNSRSKIWLLVGDQMLENLQVKPRKMSVVSPKHFMCFVFATVLVSTCRAGRQMTAFSESTLGGVSTKPDTSTELGDVAMKSITFTNPTFQVTTELKKPLNKLDAVESHESFDCNDKSLECSRGLEIRELGDHVDYVYAEVKN